MPTLRITDNLLLFCSFLEEKTSNADTQKKKNPNPNPKQIHRKEFSDRDAEVHVQSTTLVSTQ